MGPLGGGGMGEKRKRSPSPARAGDAPDKEKENGSSGARRPAGASAAAAARYAGYPVEDNDALDCSACYRPLKPPIYQCNEGHVVCLSCRDKACAGGQVP